MSSKPRCQPIEGEGERYNPTKREGKAPQQKKLSLDRRKKKPRGGLLITSSAPKGKKKRQTAFCVSATHRWPGRKKREQKTIETYRQKIASPKTHRLEREKKKGKKKKGKGLSKGRKRRRETSIEKRKDVLPSTNPVAERKNIPSTSPPSCHPHKPPSNFFKYEKERE